MHERTKNRLLGLGLLFAAAAALWFGVLREDVVPRNFGVVEPGVLYRAAALTPAATKRVVEEHKIKTIVDLGAYDTRPREGRIAERTAAALGVQRYVFGLSGDGTGNPNEYVQALKIIEDPANQPVLVHCATGAQRTGVCILLYRDVVQHKPWDGEVFEEALEHRHDPDDNPRLREFLKQHRDEIDESFRTGREIPGYAPVPAQPAAAN